MSERIWRTGQRTNAYRAKLIIDSCTEAEPKAAPPVWPWKFWLVFRAVVRLNLSGRLATCTWSWCARVCAVCIIDWEPLVGRALACVCALLCVCMCVCVAFTLNTSWKCPHFCCTRWMRSLSKIVYARARFIEYSTHITKPISRINLRYNVASEPPTDPSEHTYTSISLHSTTTVYTAHTHTRTLPQWKCIWPFWPRHVENTTSVRSKRVWFDTSIPPFNIYFGQWSRFKLILVSE